MLVYFYAHLEYVLGTWYILWSLGNFVVIWNISPRLGILCQEKSEKSGTPFFQVPLLPAAEDGRRGRAAALQLRAGDRPGQLFVAGPDPILRLLNLQAGANPSTSSYNASVVKIYNATNSVARFYIE
jgi:hypothetical protein